MTLLYTTSMDHYGSGVVAAYDNGQYDIGWDASKETTGLTIIGDTFAASPVMGSTPVAYPVGNYGIGTPPFGARRGDFALYKEAVNVTRGGRVGANNYTIQGGEGFRLAIPGPSEHVRIIHIAFAVDDLPLLPNNHGMIVGFQDLNGTPKGYLGVNPSGRLVLYDGDNWSSGGDSAGYITENPATLAVSSSPVIQAETWYSIGIKIDTTAGSGVANVDVYVGDIIPANLVIDANAVQFTNTGYDHIDVLNLLPASMAGQVNTDDSEDLTTTWLRDVVVCNNSGTYNNDLLGQVFVAAQEMRAEDSGGGWTAHPRENIGTGVLDHKDASTGMYIADNAAFELGSADFTLEGFFRFDEVPSSGEAILISKWSEDDNNRSYKLTWNASDDTLRWEVSTDGSAVTTVFTYPWTPDLQQWYHIAVVRDTAVTKVFVNGTQLGVDIADANTYYDGGANFGIASRWDSSNTLDTDSVFVGWLDEIRLTPGIVRYTVDFTPTTVKFGRNSVDDTDFTSVDLLLGFDGVILDESSNAWSITTGAGVQAEQPDDEGLKYEVLNQRPAWDDTYIEARNTFATNILTLTANPTASETVTLGSITYTFVASVSVANDVAIGADTEETLSNLIAAVNAGAGAGTAYGTGTTANTAVFAATLPDPQALFTAVTIGTAGNSVVSTETLTNGSFKEGATFAGGEDIPSPEDFAMERLPVDVTGVLGLQITARGYKSDAGSAQLRFDLVGPAAAVDTGTALGTDLNPAWLRQVFEEDPDTSATITPSTITGGRVRVTRTA